MKRVFGVLALLVVPALCACDVTEALILRPSDVVTRTPAAFEFAFDTMELPAENGGIVSIWHVRSTVERKGTIVIVPGNDANKSRFTTGLPIFIDDGWDVILMDYEGYGESTGQASFAGLIRSANTVMRYAMSQDEVVVGYGVSLGTTVLARVAADHDLAACIFESTLNIWDEASLFVERNLIGTPLTKPLDLIAAVTTSQDYNIKYWITQVSGPKLFLHSTQDSVTPFKGAMEVFELAPEPKHLFITRGEHAMQVFIDPGLYRAVVNGWLDGALNIDPIENAFFQELLETEVRAALEAVGFLPPD